MTQVPRKVAARISAGIKRFQPIIASAKLRDASEANTVMIVTAMLSEVFGYDNFSEITSECPIRGTWCDLAIKIGDTYEYLIEVKAIGSALKDFQKRQAVNYSANEEKDKDWVILTNAETWRIYKVTCFKRIDSELIVEINFSELNSKKSGDIELLYNLTREGLMKSALGEFHIQQQALSRFLIGALVVSNPVLSVIRRELRCISPNVRIDIEQIKSVLVNDVLKREVVESEKAEEARKKINRAAGKLLRASAAKQSIEPEKQPEKIETKTEREETEPEI